MREDEVYVATKTWFNKSGFITLAGQPPNGCDNVPAIEIKEISNTSKGSKGSIKPDLVFANTHYLILVECKPLDDLGDENKLLEIESDRNRQRLLFEEITQRNIFKRKGLDNYFPDLISFCKKLRFCLAHSGKPREMDKVFTLAISSIKGEGLITKPRIPAYSIDY